MATAQTICGEGTRASLKLSSGQRTALAFHRERDPQQLQLTFDVVDCEFPDNADDKDKRTLRVKFFPVLNDDGDRLELDTLDDGDRWIRASAVVENRNTVVVDFELNPRLTARPGTYNAGFVVDDPVVNPVQVPVTVTLQYQRAGVLFWSIMAPALVAGSLSVWWKAKLAGSDEPYRRWWLRLGNWFGVVAGFIAAQAAWSNGYLDDLDFGADLPPLGKPWDLFQWPILSKQWAGLAAVMITAFLGALTAASLGGDLARKKKAEVDAGAADEI